MLEYRPGNIAVERLKIAICCKNCEELIQRLGTARKTLTETRKSGRLPQALRERLVERGVNPLWVETGLGARRVRDCSACERLLLRMATVTPRCSRQPLQVRH